MRPHPPRFLVQGRVWTCPPAGRSSPHPQRPRIPPWAAGALSRFPRRKRGGTTVTIAICVYLGNQTRSLARAAPRRHTPESAPLSARTRPRLCQLLARGTLGGARGPGWRRARSHLAPGQGGDCQSRRQQEVGASDYQRGGKRGQRLPWGRGAPLTGTVGLRPPVLVGTGLPPGRSEDGRLSPGEATFTPADMGKNASCRGTMNCPQGLQGRRAWGRAEKQHPVATMTVGGAARGPRLQRLLQPHLCQACHPGHPAG